MVTSQQAKTARLQLGLSQNLIAKTTGLSRPYLSNFEADKFNPKDEFKETLKAFYIKEGVIFDDEEINPVKGDNLKLVNGFQIDTDCISIDEVQALTENINIVSMDLLELTNKNLPIKDGFFFRSVDSEAVQNTIDAIIKKMAIAYLDLLELQGQNSINTEAQKLPNLEDISTDEYANHAIGDYLSNTLFS